jgi:hypothetical protein
MSDRALKNLIMIVMVILVLNQFVGWVAGFWGAVPGVLAALVVVVVSFLFGRKARADAGNAAWFLVPVLLFAVIPTGVRLWGFFANEKSVWTRLWDGLPFVMGFLVPIGTLLLVYWSLGRSKRQPAAPPRARD